jgi:hypothetical protein
LLKLYTGVICYHPTHPYHLPLQPYLNQENLKRCFTI